MTNDSANGGIKVRVKELANLFSIREKDILLLHERGIIDVDDPDVERVLAPLSRVWHSNEFLRRMLSYRKRRTRRKLIDTADLSKPEMHAYTRLKEGDPADTELKRRVLSELITFYRIKRDRAIRIVSRMAMKVKKERYYQRKRMEE